MFFRESENIFKLKHVLKVRFKNYIEVKFITVLFALVSS